MQHDDKSEIIGYIVPNDFDNQRPETTAVILYRAVLVQIIRPKNSEAIGESYLIICYYTYSLG